MGGHCAPVPRRRACAKRMQAGVLPGPSGPQGRRRSAQILPGLWVKSAASAYGISADSYQINSRQKGPGAAGTRALARMCRAAAFSLRCSAAPGGPAPLRPGRPAPGTGRPAARRASAVSMAMNSPRISSVCVVRVAPCRPWRSRAITSPSARPRWAASWYRITSSKASPRITVCVADVLVAPVAGAADDDAAALGRQRVHGGHQGAHGVGVVAVVGDHGRAAVVHHVEAARRVVAVVDEAREAACGWSPTTGPRPRPRPRRP